MKQRIWAAMIAASLGWGTGGVATRSAFDQGLEPFGLSTARAALAAVLVVVYLMLRGRGVPRGRTVWGVGLVMGITNLALPFALFTLAYQYASAGFVGLLAALIPISTAAWAHLLLPAEQLTIRKMGGLLIALAGVAVLLASGDSGLAEGGRPLLAFVLGTGAVAILGFAGAYAKRSAGAYDPIDLTGAQFATGTVALVALTAVFEGAPAGVTGEGWVLVGYLAAASTFLPFAMFYWLLRHVSATQASLIGYLVPLIAVVAGVVLLSEELTPGLALGGALILTGVIVTDRLEQRRVAVPGWRAGSPPTAAPPPPAATTPIRRPRRKR